MRFDEENADTEENPDSEGAIPAEENADGIPGDTPDEGITELTAELIDQLVSALESEHDVLDAAVDFVKSKKDVLIGLAVDPFLNLLRSVGSRDADLLQVKRDFIKTLPTMSMVNAFNEESIESLERSAHPQLVLGSFLSSLADIGTAVAPRVLGVLNSLL